MNDQALDNYFDSEAFARTIDETGLTLTTPMGIYKCDGQRLWESSEGTLPQVFPEFSCPPITEDDEAAALRLGNGRRPISSPAGGQYLAEPIELDGKVVGFLICAGDDTACAPERAAGFSRLCAAIAAKICEKNRAVEGLSDELAARYEELSLVYELASALDVSRPPREALKHLFKTLTETLQVDFAFIGIPDHDTFEGYPESKVNLTEWEAVCDTLLDCLRHEDGCLVRNNFADDLDFTALAGYARDYAHVASTLLRVDGKLGVLAVFRAAGRDNWLTGDVKLLESIGQHISTFLTNRKIVQERERLFDATVFGLARLAESRDDNTGQHLDRVMFYCRLLAEEARCDPNYASQITDKFCDQVFRSSSLHDIGKVGIADSILLKPGKLTEEEFETMKTHTVLGADTIRDIRDRLGKSGATFLTMGHEIALSHHEKWNGSGYPNGLAGTDIPLAARIVAVADVYDALTSKRPYKRAFTHQDARNILVHDAGSHFDPGLIEAFLRTESMFVVINEDMHADHDHSSETKS